MADISEPAIRLIDLGLVPPWQTQAYYHAVAECMTIESPDTIILCRPSEPYLCLGYHQIYAEMLDVEECNRRGLPVFRRRVGGGTTYLDANQLFYQCIFHHKRLPYQFRDVYAQILAGPVATLQRLGLNGALRAVNEVEVDGKRIAGIGGGRIGQANVVVGNLLFDFDFQTMTQVWNTPSQSFRELAKEALADRLATLCTLLDGIQIEEVKNILIEEFENTMQRPLELGSLTEKELQTADEIYHRISSPEYLELHRDDREFGALQELKISADVFIHAAQADINGQQIQGSFRVDEGVITKAHLASTPEKDWTLDEAGLEGQPFNGWEETLLVTE